MKWKIRKYLLKIAIAILALYIATTTVKSFMQPIQQPRIIQQVENKQEYIISEKAIMSKLTMKSQIVSLQQNIDKRETLVDDGFFGERKTELKLHGTYKFGLETKDIKLLHIDNSTGTIYIHIGKPVLINLDIPFDEIDFSKTSGWLRMAMDENEQKNFYKSSEKRIEQDLMKDKNLMRQVDLYNQEVVKDILQLVPGVNDIVFK